MLIQHQPAQVCSSKSSGFFGIARCRERVLKFAACQAGVHLTPIPQV